MCVMEACNSLCWFAKPVDSLCNQNPVKGTEEWLCRTRDKDSTAWKGLLGWKEHCKHKAGSLNWYLFPHFIPFFLWLSDSRKGWVTLNVSLSRLGSTSVHVRTASALRWGIRRVVHKRNTGAASVTSAKPLSGFIWQPTHIFLFVN